VLAEHRSDLPSAVDPAQLYLPASVDTRRRSAVCCYETGRGGKPNRARATNLAATAACILSKITTVIRQYLPMAPTLVRAPFHRVGWIYEEKVDGYRMLAYKEDAHVRLVSRNGVDHTRRYPDVAAAVAQLRPSTLVLDGELAVFDEQLRSRFEWLRDPDPTAVATPPVLIAFDVLYVKGRDVSQRPLRERRARLEDLLAAADAVYSVRRLAADGLEAWAQVVERGYEGLVAKDEASAYEGGRTIRWLKVKQKGWTVEEDRWRRRISVAPSRGPKGKRTTPPLAPHQPRSARDAAHSAIDTRKPVSCGWGKTVTGIAASSTGVVRRSSAVEQAPSLPRGFTAVLPSTLRRGHGQSSRWCPPDRISTFY